MQIPKLTPFFPGVNGHVDSQAKSDGTEYGCGAVSSALYYMPESPEIYELAVLSRRSDLMSRRDKQLIMIGQMRPVKCRGKE